jgi:hypothetical protein
MHHWRQFKEDVAEAERLLDIVRDEGSRLRDEVETVFRSEGIPVTTMLVGSTNPDRMTTTIDPRAPDERYQSDFDLVAITSRNLEEDHKKKILEKIFPEGKTIQTHGRTERMTSRGKFPVSIEILTEEEAKKDVVVKYATTTSFTMHDLREIRAARLYFMRNGLYGGFTRGFKGIAIEQLVKREGGLAELLEKISLMPEPEKLDVPSPADGKNLVSNVQSDIFRRLHIAASITTEQGWIKASPYGIESWINEHPQAVNFGLTASGSEPREEYLRTERFLKRANTQKTEGTEYHILVIPKFSGGEVLVSIENPDVNKSQIVAYNFRRRWESR